MYIVAEKTKKFRAKLARLSRDDLLEIIEQQDPELRDDIEYVEKVFREKLTHLTWRDGSPITERPFTNEELALMIDEPFEFSQELAETGMTIEQQRQIHYAKDPVTWARHFLKQKPRVYQIIMLRDPSRFKVFRMGRRSGKTFTMAILLLHYSYTTQYGRSLVVTPMLAQAKLIWEEIMRLADESQVVKDSIIRAVQNPQAEVGFSNGSTIRFFTSGMKSGGKSDITRGQEAHLIVLDELDYMGDDDLEALLAMMQKTSENQKDKMMVGASTPSGKQAVFWKWCTEGKFREFWFPAYCNPYWDAEQEEWFRSEYSEMGYRHEIEADWGENVEGVYPRRIVDAAFYFNPEDPDDNGWNYDPFPHHQQSIRVMGVDWDKYGAGCNIVVLEYFQGPLIFDDDLRGQIRLIYREETTREKFTYLKAVNRIIELNQILNPKWIYVDRGAGEVQVEMLHAHGLEVPSSKLGTKVKGIQFGESVEIRDPFTMQKVKKEVKPFMVETLRQMMERNQIHFPRHDTELYQQLTNYVVARTTATGKPVFEMTGKGEDGKLGDHAHDALILACLAIEQNYGEWMKTNYATSGKVVSNAVFLPLIDIGNDKGPIKSVNSKGEIKVASSNEDKALPPSVAARRPMSYNLRRSKTIKRKMF